MLSWLRKKSSSTRHIGIDLNDDGFGVAVIEERVGAPPRVTAARWFPIGPQQGRAARLAEAAAACDAHGLAVVATLPHASYSLVQLEAPDIPEAELAEAMRWRIKDLIDFPVEEAVVDLVHLPPSNRAGAQPLLYVVVARERDVASVARDLQAAGLDIAAVDIAEMAVRNLSLHLDRPARPRAYLHMQPGQTLIEIVDGERIFLSRRVQQEFDADADPVVLRAQLENLALEVQRSLDYFESQYALGPADKLSVLACAPRLYATFEEIARDFLTVSIERFDLDTLDVADGVDLSRLGRGAAALGAAMRRLPWAA